MKTFRKIAIIAAAMAVAASAMAQTQLKVSTGSSSGTYSRMFKEFNQSCKNEIMQVEMPSTGSVQNMDRLLGNEVNAAIVQTDVLFHRSRNEDLGNIKTLFSLHPEEVHVITMTTSPVKVGGTMGLGAKPLKINTVNDLAGQRVAAWGGSFITAQVIRLQTEIAFNVVEVADFKSAQAALKSGTVAAIVMVGGQPMADVQSLTNEYKLVNFPEVVTAKLKSVYVPARLNYSNLGAGGQGVPTVATEALFVTRAYKTAKYVESLASLRNCFKSSVDELAETTGTHKKWSAVKADNEGKWSYYQLPEVKSAAKK